LEPPIPPSPDPLTGGNYSFQDTDVKRGQPYYYTLEEIEAGGTTTQHGPITQKATNAAIANLLLAAALLGNAGLYTRLLLTAPNHYQGAGSRD